MTKEKPPPQPAPRPPNGAPEEQIRDFKIKQATDPDNLKAGWEDVRTRSASDLTHHQCCEEFCNALKFDAFIDVGPGYVGSEAWSINQLKPECPIYGFEPQTERFNLLKENAYPGRLENIAISDHNGFLEGGMGFPGGFTDFVANVSGLSLELGLYKPTSVPTKTLDTVIAEENLENVFVWADIEGAELLLIKGAPRSLKSGKIIGLWLELNSKLDSAGLQSNFCTADEVIRFLSYVNFHPHRGAPWERIRQERAELAPEGDGQHYDCLFVRY